MNRRTFLAAAAAAPAMGVGLAGCIEDPTIDDVEVTYQHSVEGNTVDVYVQAVDPCDDDEGRHHVSKAVFEVTVNGVSESVMENLEGCDDVERFVVPTTLDAPPEDVEVSVDVLEVSA